MKKIKSILLSMLMLFTFLATPNCADAAVGETTVTYLDDGDRIETTIIEEPSTKRPGIQPYTTTVEMTRSKISRYYNGDNKVMWYIKVTGTFTYNGTTSKCLKSSVTAESYNSTWKVSQLSAARSGATALASCKAKQYMANLLIASMDGFVTLTCDRNGNLS
ncbi:MAG: hypothetical protein HFH14_08410 [Lachnospiraceae bacterium]|nr:hypothetical protein [Lachnospiraceae bacterium]